MFAWCRDGGLGRVGVVSDGRFDGRRRRGWVFGVQDDGVGVGKEVHYGVGWAFRGGDSCLVLPWSLEASNYSTRVLGVSTSVVDLTSPSENQGLHMTSIQLQFYRPILIIQKHSVVISRG